MNYSTSKDYERLWNLVKKGKRVPCLYYDRGIQRAGIAQKCCETPTPPGGGFCPNKEIFIQCCEADQVEMLLPTAWIKIESDKELPTEGRKYLIRCKYGTETGIFNNGVFRSQITDVTLSGVTHWKPMPEAPEVGQ